MKKIEIPHFEEKSDLFAFLLKNKAALMQEKRLSVKECDGFSYVGPSVAKAATITPAGNTLAVKAIINTTNWMDSHKDVHLPGLWKKSLSENKMIMHLQEHDMEFDKIIADGNDLVASVKNYTWKSLGYDYPGATQALVFDSQVHKERNPYMFDQYAKGYVRNHSVGMQYIKMVLCVDEPDNTSYGAEFEAWEKYYPEIANKDYADEVGYFWAILEAKIIEGSAVPRGSNIVTPTISANLKNEPLNDGTQEGAGVSPLKKLNQLLDTKNIF